MIRPKGWSCSQQANSDYSCETYTPHDDEPDVGSVYLSNEITSHTTTRLTLREDFQLDYNAAPVFQRALHDNNWSSLPGLCVTVKVEYADVCEIRHYLQWSWLPGSRYARPTDRCLSHTN
jgi:hypothetical protein